MAEGFTETRETLEFFEARKKDLLECVIDLVRRDTPTGDVDASRAFVSHYRALLERLGLSCREYESEIGVHLAADRYPEGGHRADASAPDVALVLHSDTVWPMGETSRRPPVLRDGLLFGPGVCDMKASLAQAIFVLRFLEETGRGRDLHVRVFVSADEEHGSVVARRFLEREVPSETTAFVLEPPLPDGALKTARKGVGIYSIEIRGRASHAGTDPHGGISAIDEFTAQAQVLQRLRDPSRGITVNIGTVAGGTASNVIPERVLAAIDVRFGDPADGERIDGILRALERHDPRTEITVGGGIVFPPMEPTGASLDEARRYVDVAREFGVDVGTGKSGGGSDGSFLASRGVVTLDGLGIDGGGAHALDEHIVVDRLPLRTALLAELLLRR